MFNTEKVAIVSWSDLPQYLQETVQSWDSFNDCIYLDITNDLKTAEGQWRTKLGALEFLSAACNDIDFDGSMEDFAREYGYVFIYWIANSGVVIPEVDRILLYTN